MKTVAVPLTAVEVDHLCFAFEAHLLNLPRWRQQSEGRELVIVWLKLTSAAREAGSLFAHEYNLPKWTRQLMLTLLQSVLATPPRPVRIRGPARRRPPAPPTILPAAGDVDATLHLLEHQRVLRRAARVRELPHTEGG